MDQTKPGVVEQSPPLPPELLSRMDAYWRAANYLSVGQIYLFDNPLLREPLRLEHVKARLLGHWGTTPGQHFVYGYGSTTTWFTVHADGTIDYDPALEGVFTGRGTRALGIRGVTVQVDARALSGSFLAFDYVSHDPSAPLAVVRPAM